MLNMFVLTKFAWNKSALPKFALTKFAWNKFALPMFVWNKFALTMFALTIFVSKCDLRDECLPVGTSIECLDVEADVVLLELLNGFEFLLGAVWVALDHQTHHLEQFLNSLHTHTHKHKVH